MKLAEITLTGGATYMTNHSPEEVHSKSLIQMETWTNIFTYLSLIELKDSAERG